ncbi:hypothetical protein [Neptunomonas sp.]|uniref:hypothetical protein n=1 Tax=Neptunomonas sp. TaxID=1971898 RepID=UPI0025F0CB50|nr:hypothetical protein [Neptunomonas sp.]
MSGLFRRMCILVCSSVALTVPLLTAAEENRVGLEQMKLATSVGARCSGFYDGMFALLHNLSQGSDVQALGVVKGNWEGLDKRYVFRQSTSAMLMTGIFIKQMNQKFTSEQRFSFQSFSQDYVSSRKAAMSWKDDENYNTELGQQRQQCEHILQIAMRNGTLNKQMIDGAMQKRSIALGVDLQATD